MAWWYRQYANEQPVADRGQYEFAEQEAKARKAGLWTEPNPIPPWKWRRGQTGAADAGATGDCRIKGNISAKGERIYHVPGQRHYTDTQIRESNGERWFCTEAQANAAGWRASKW